MKTHLGFRRFAWSLLAYNVLVVLWGAYVRASKSGDGCGAHWPTCGGQLIPTNVQHVKTWIEVSHRYSTVLLLPLIILLVVWARRAFPPGSPVRLGAGLVGFFTLVEALIGAGLVLYKLVAHDASGYRVVALSAHLVNTMLLLGAITLTAAWASGLPRLRIRQSGALGAWCAVALIGTLMLGVTGAIAALGDTLYPADSLLEGIRHDFASDAAFIVRHRPLHPLWATTMLAVVWMTTLAASRLNPSPQVLAWGTRARWLFVAQWIFGWVNLGFLAPIPLQLAHLLLADALWISLVMFAASALSRQENEIPETARAGREVAWPINSPSLP